MIDRHPHMDRVTVISACSGHGFKHSAGVAERVVRQVQSGLPDEGLKAFGLARFASL